MKKKKDQIDDMSDTFVLDVGQKSAIAEDRLDDISGKVDVKDSAEYERENTGIIEVEKSMKPPKKKNSIGLIFIILFSFLFGVLGTYFYFEYFQKEEKVEKEEKEETVEKKEIEIDPGTPFLEELIEDYDAYSISNVELYETLYAKEKVSVEELDDDYARTLVVKKLGDFFSAKKFNNTATLLFGGKKTFPLESFQIGDNCVRYQYDEKDDSFQKKNGDGCGGSSDYSLERKIVKAVQKEDKIEVNVAIAIIGRDEIYQGYEDGKGVDSLVELTPDTFDIEKDYTELKQYQYTFLYDSKNYQYYFSEIEIVE